MVDDAAVIAPPPGCDVVLTTDGVIAGVHFFPDDPPEDDRPQSVADESVRSRRQGREAARLSAVARAAGGQSTKHGSRLSPAALARTRERYGCPLLGGDTDRTPGPTSVSIAAFGTVPHGTMVRRSTAQGRAIVIVVTGTIGDAALGVLLRRDAKPGASAGG